MKSLFNWGMMIGLAGLACDRADAGFVLTANAAGSQSSTVDGVTTECFNEFKPGAYTTLKTAVGTLSSPGMEVVEKDQYGGAGGSGNYLAIGAQSGQTSATLTLNGSDAYFGFWWSAADPLNSIEFLSKGTVVAEFDSASTLGSLGSSYLGNPNGGDSSEKFAYLNVIGTRGSTFDQVVFLNSGTSTGFESDNWSVRCSPPECYPGTKIGDLPGISPTAVPEPSSLVLTASGVLGLAGLARSRRRS